MASRTPAFRHSMPPTLSLAFLVSLSWGGPDSSETRTFSGPVRWGVPILEVLGSNGLIAAHNKWISRAHYGQISPATMRRNLRSGLVWDEDNFVVNQIGHPYQGGLYYSAARHFGHGYWTSMGHAALGSLQWEFLMETEPPAFNDLITTTLGGAMLGEITHRLSREILDDRSRGVERFFREALATLVNPMYGLNRMLDGSAFKSSRTEPRRAPLEFRVATGAVLGFRTDATPSATANAGKVPKATTEVLFWYGDEFAAKRPFDFFVVNVGLNVVSDPVASVYARSLIANRHLFGSGEDYGILTLGQNFDYINSGIYKFGASGFGGGYSHRFRWGRRWYHYLQVMAGGITLGGASSEFFRIGERDYNLGPGAFSTTRIVLGRREFGHAALNLDRYWIYALSGASGLEFIGIGIVELSKSIYKNLGGILSYTFYDRTAWYDHYPIQSRLNQELRLSLNYGFQ